MTQRSAEELTAGLAEVGRSPVGTGTVELIVRRPAVEEREVVDTADLDLEVGLVGDNWSTRGSAGSPDPARQLTLMNARAAALVAVDTARWPLAGDQLYVDLHLGGAELPPGTRVAIGESAVIEVSAAPHTGCAKFSARFGVDALRVVNSPEGRALNMRGINARVITPGTIRRGDTLQVSPAELEPDSAAGRTLPLTG
jgi:MOSC domain-containing protein YiiM